MKLACADRRGSLKASRLAYKAKRHALIHIVDGNGTVRTRFSNAPDRYFRSGVVVTTAHRFRRFSDGCVAASAVQFAGSASPHADEAAYWYRRRLPRAATARTDFLKPVRVRFA